MTSLYAALRDTPALITDLDGPRIRRVRYGGATIAVHSDDDVSIVMMLTEQHRAVRRAEGRFEVGEPKVGTVTIVPPGCPTTFDVQGMATVLVLDLPWTDLRRWAAEDHDLDPARVEVQPRLVHFDQVLARQFWLVAAGIAHEDDALRAIGRQLLQKHLRGPAITPEPPAGGFAPSRLRRVCEKIDAELEQPLALADLAKEAGMSTFHFAREFRLATGAAPHQYLVRRRLARAIMLLADEELSITRVAAEVGFAHASHMARHLRRFTGLAPMSLRKALLRA